MPAIIHFADDLAGDLARFAVLFDDEQNAEVAGDRAELLESLDPELAILAVGVAERQDVRDFGGGGLLEAVREHFDAVWRLGIDAREHHDGRQAHVAARSASSLALAGGASAAMTGTRFAFAGFAMRRAPSDELKAGGFDAFERAGQRILAIRQRHAGDLKFCGGLLSRA